MQVPQDIVNWFTVIGTVVTVVALCITLYQLWLVKKETRAYQTQVRKEVEDAQDKIKTGLSISMVPQCILYIRDTIHYLQQGKYELAEIRMEDAEMLLDEIYTDDTFRNDDDKHVYYSCLRDFKESLRSLQSNIQQPLLMNVGHITRNLSNMSSELSKLNGNQKKSLYE